MTVSSREDSGHGDDGRGVGSTRNRCLLRHSIEILRDLGLSREKITSRTTVAFRHQRPQLVEVRRNDRLSRERSFHRRPDAAEEAGPRGECGPASR